MSKPTGTVLALISALAAACSSPSPVTPGESTPAGSSQSARAATPSPGVYDLSFRAFLSGGFQEVFSLPVNRELILMAHVADGIGQPAPRGTAAFEYCSSLPGIERLEELLRLNRGVLGHVRKQ